MTSLSSAGSPKIRGSPVRIVSTLRRKPGADPGSPNTGVAGEEIPELRRSAHRLHAWRLQPWPAIARTHEAWIEFESRPPGIRSP